MSIPSAERIIEALAVILGARYNIKIKYTIEEVKK